MKIPEKYHASFPIKAKLTILMTGIIAAAVFLTGIVSFEITKEAMHEHILDSLKALSSARAHEIDSLIEQDFERSALIASRTKLRECLSAYNDPIANRAELSADMNKILKDAKKSVSAIKDVYVIDLSGRVVAATVSAEIGKDMSRQMLFREGSSKPARSPLKLVSGELSYNTAVPMFHPIDGSKIGVAISEINMNRLVSILNDFSGLGETGELVIGEKQGQKIALFSPMRQNAGGLQKMLMEPKSIEFTPLARVLNTRNKAVTIATDHRGKTILAASQYVDSAHWGLIAKIDTDEAFKPIAILQRNVLLLGFLLLLVGTMISILASKAITNRIEAIRNGAVKIANGDLDFKIEKPGAHDELAELAESFNIMARQLHNDIRSREQIEEKLSRANAFLQMTMDSMPDAIAIVDVNNLEIIDCNKVFLRSYKKSKANVIGRKCFEVIHKQSEPCTLPHDLCPIPDMMELRKNVTIEHVHYYNDTEEYVEVSVSPIFNENNEITQAVHVNRNITERKNTERALSQANVQVIQSEKMAAVGALACKIAKELSGPLKIIKDSLAEVKSEIRVEDLARLQGATSNEIKRCTQIIEDLMEYGQPHKIGTKDFDCRTVLVKLEEKYRKRLNDSLIKYRFLTPDQEIIVLGSQTYLEQVLGSLIDNAIEAMETTKEKVLTVSLISGNNTIRLEVIDSGKGIPSQDIPQIFEPFYSTKERGTGFGLTICQTILKGWGGILQFDSEQGKGTRAIVTLPVCPKISSEDESLLHREA